MKIATATPQPKRKLELGDVIVAKHLSTSKVLHYQLIKLGHTGKFYLLNLKTNFIMESFESAYPQSAIDYVEVATRSKVTEIVPSNMLTLILGQEPSILNLNKKLEDDFHRHLVKRFS